MFTAIDWETLLGVEGPALGRAYEEYVYESTYGYEVPFYPCDEDGE